MECRTEDSIQGVGWTQEGSNEVGWDQSLQEGDQAHRVEDQNQGNRSLVVGRAHRVEDQNQVIGPLVLGGLKFRQCGQRGGLDLRCLQLE